MVDFRKAIEPKKHNKEKIQVVAEWIFLCEQPNYKRFSKINEVEPSPVYEAAQFCFTCFEWYGKFEENKLIKFSQTKPKDYLHAKIFFHPLNI